ncbi:MAG: N-acetylmuramoyl-L-alanine amidase [Chloroflexota bacterium]|nr:N-acetylmuramoyl-L-alanine amidase [Chloroflexota bacterium]
MAFFVVPPLSIVDVPADKHHRVIPLTRRSIRFIYLHATGAPEGSDSLAWLSTSSDPPVSCHRLISRNGIIHKIVPDEWIAFTQGFGVMGRRSKDTVNLNRDGLSIEFENSNRLHPPFERYDDAQLRSGAWQVVEWWSFYGFLPVLRHSDVDANKHDPSGFPWEQFNSILLAVLRSCL